ncbi:hypothetical protein VW29_06875 [Devosia limi DSM 17137]|uniref:DUF4345 domain-containing protein n=1 Tax=Devosia limi DSM 17137 TaxID=1121477 RepID=A0A0F5LSC0_9HYPH|nr:hypothetical protein [Devosia limi]KKB85270.1 hypothetical protein VW29_06875 [Devosia limi DSM 17137]SHF87988.1 hypothetical protein SAMN02745223_03776 [Devosia limi DSM 17137]
MLLAFLVVVTAINVLVATGFSLAGIFLPGLIVRGGEGSHTARVFALYGLARSLPLLLVAAWAILTTSLPGLLWVGTLAGVSLLADAAVGTQTGDRLKVWGPLGLGALQIIAVLLAAWWA